MNSFVVRLLLFTTVSNWVAAGAKSLDQDLTVVGQRCNKTAECSRECGKIIYCEGEYVVNDGVSCPASHPHCVTDVVGDFCSNRRQLARPDCRGDISALNRDFFCTSEGYFPDPRNCSRYIICQEKTDGSLTPLTYSCPSFRYRFAQSQCSFWSNSGVPANLCPVISCDSADGYARVFPNLPQYFYFCIHNPLSLKLDPVLFRCDDGWTFNGNSCVLTCPSVGNVPVPGNSTAYYSCLVRGATPSALLNCPRGYVFSSGLGYCVAL